MKKIFVLLCLLISLLAAIPLRALATETSTVQYTSDGNYTITIPDYIEADTEGVIVEMSDVLLPYDHELSITVEFDNLLHLKDASSITIPYKILADEKEYQSGDTILRQNAGNPQKSTSVKLAAQVTESPLYSGIYTSTVVFNIGIDEIIETNYSPEEIKNDPLLFGIGRTKSEYVVAEFNDDYTSVVITKNGEKSDGIMKGFAYTDESHYSPMRNNSSTLTHAVIKEGITNIGEFSFSYCNKLQGVSIANSVTSIGNNAFGDCTSLNNVILPNNLSTMGTGVFKNCTSLEHITIPDTVTSIGHTTFQFCSNLKSVIIGSNVPSITVSMFEYCTSLKEICIPNSVTAVEQAAFNGCDNLEKVVFGNSIKSIGYRTFYGCKSLQEVMLHDGLTSISTQAFFDCKSIKNAVIPDSVTNISNGAFSGCVNLESVTIPKSLTVINMSVFSGCKSLKNITLPNGLTKIDTQAFSGCESLGNFSIPDSVTSIGNNAFLGCKSLTCITIPNCVQMLGQSAFSGCEKLERITLPKGLTEIASGLFSGCTYLYDISIPDTVTSIGNRAFQYCSSLPYITIPTNVTSIGDYAFYSCHNIKEIYLHKNITFLGEVVFGYMKSLERFDVDDDNQHFCQKDGVLYSKDMRTLLQIPLSTNMETYVVPNSVTTLVKECIGSCSDIKHLRDIYVGNSVTEIADWILSNNSSNKIKIHTPNGSAMENYCINKRILYDNEMI